MKLYRTLLADMAGLSLSFGVLISGRGAGAAVILSLDPQPPKIHGAETVFRGLHHIRTEHDAWRL